MLRFDKLKLISSTQYVRNVNTNLFVTNSKNGELLYYKYQQKSPCSLLIMVDYNRNELSIEFTSKILKEQCIDLINHTNIKKCLLNINELKICSLDVDNLINNSIVTKCDITKDVVCSDMDMVISYVTQNLSNYRKWICKSYQYNGLCIENVVSTPRYKKRLSIYNKGKEIKKATNESFLNQLSDRSKVLAYYDGKLRFELNINTMNQIREMLSIDNNTLTNVLQANTNPILKVLDEAVIFHLTTSRKSTTLRDYERELLLKSCNYDLSKVEATIRSLISKTTSVSRIMEPYRKLWEHYHHNQSHAIDIRAMVA